MSSTLKRKTKLFLMAGLVAVMAVADGDSVSGQGSTPCGMQMNTAPVIFCDTFDQPFPVTNRSGQLDGVVWGVSRLDGGSNTFRTSVIESCNGPLPVTPPFDIMVCNGRLRQSLEDGAGVNVVALYPKQPFDFAGRTGTVSFDVTNDNSGSHGAWPEFWLTDLPTPAPFLHSPICDFCSVPRNGFGLRFDAEGCPGGGWWAGSVIVVRDYVVEEKGMFDNTPGMRLQAFDCASESSGPNGGLNHIELRISQNTIDVYASNAGTTALKRINTVTNANLSLTRGLIWIEDGHYNASKGTDPSHHNHTFTWDNVAFDGPATYRDLSYDVLDRLLPMGGNVVKLGWEPTPSSPVSLATLPMTAQAIAASTRALLMFNFSGPQSLTFNYSVNGHAVSVPSPVPAPLQGQRAVSFEVPLSHLVAGPQNIVLSASQPITVQNVNIVLVAAAPVPPVQGYLPPGVPTGLRILP